MSSDPKLPYTDPTADPGVNSSPSTEPPRLGFIVNSQQRTVQNRCQLRLFGRGDNGSSFVVQRWFRPYLYLHRTDLDSAQQCWRQGDARVEEGEFRSMAGSPMCRVSFATTQALRQGEHALKQAQLPAFEGDVRPTWRYAIDRGIRGGCRLLGEPSWDRALGWCFEEAEPAHVSPQLRVLSFDIETDPKGERLFSIAWATSDAQRALLAKPFERDIDHTQWCDDEKGALAAFIEDLRQLDPDVITGWNIEDFDLPVLEKVARRCGIRMTLGRDGSVPRFRVPGRRGPLMVTGRVVLDGIALLRNSFVRLESYSLESASQAILQRGKSIAQEPQEGRAWEIVRMFRDDLPAFVRYNIDDARLVLEILDRLQLLELSVERSRVTGMPLDRVASSIASFDFLYLMELRKRHIVAPRLGEVEVGENNHGGYVMEPIPGLFRNVAVFDFKSLYPSIMRTFQIDPLGLITDSADVPDPIIAPNGALFRREKGILTEILDELMPRRDRAKDRGDAVASQAIKILMNSLYGVLGTPACRFHNPLLSNAITSCGRELLLWCKGEAERLGYRVLYGDTDSLFVAMAHPAPTTDHDAAPDTESAASERATTLCAELNQALREHLAQKWRVESQLELQFERLYSQLFLPAVRRGTEGARKRYAGWVKRRDGEKQDYEVVFTGMEAVRSDWTEVARRVQRELYRRLFRGEGVAQYLRQVVADVRDGKCDEELVYRKSLRKPLSSYTRTTPPHVAAARKMTTTPGRVIRYFMTTAGPEPAQERKNRIDTEHYVYKQIQPVAEPVLAILNQSFAGVVGGGEQLELF